MFFVLLIQNCFSRLSFYILFLQTYKNEMNAHIVTPTEKDQPPSDGSISSPLCVSHPVSQKKKDVYRTNQTTFIIGETPKGIRRYVVCGNSRLRLILRRSIAS